MPRVVIVLDTGLSPKGVEEWFRNCVRHTWPTPVDPDIQVKVGNHREAQDSATSELADPSNVVRSEN